MAVYVDNFKAVFGRMIMSHMIADTHEELVAMADKVGLKRDWIQHEGEYCEHFDVCLEKRKLAIKYGAIDITPKELVIKMREKKIKRIA